MNGPTMRCGIPGRTLRTENPPRSRVCGLSRKRALALMRAADKAAMIRLSAPERVFASDEAAVFPQHLLALLGRRRNREVIALDLVAAVRGEQLELLLRFHALGHDFQFEAVREADDRECDHGVLGVGGDVANEGVVDLERIDRKTLQVCEARVARPEIVHRDPHTRALQPAKSARSALRIAHQQRLGELELDERRIDARFPQDVPHDGLEILLLELARRGSPSRALPRARPAAMPESARTLRATPVRPPARSGPCPPEPKRIPPGGSDPSRDAASAAAPRNR